MSILKRSFWNCGDRHKHTHLHGRSAAPSAPAALSVAFLQLWLRITVVATVGLRGCSHHHPTPTTHLMSLSYVCVWQSGDQLSRFTTQMQLVHFWASSLIFDDHHPSVLLRNNLINVTQRCLSKNSNNQRKTERTKMDSGAWQDVMCRTDMWSIPRYPGYWQQCRYICRWFCLCISCGWLRCILTKR